MSLTRSRYSWLIGSALICSLDSPLLIDADSLSMSVADAVTVTFSETPWIPSSALTTVSVASWTCAFRVTVCIPDRVKVTV